MGLTQPSKATVIFGRPICASRPRPRIVLVMTLHTRCGRGKPRPLVRSGGSGRLDAPPYSDDQRFNDRGPVGDASRICGGCPRALLRGSCRSSTSRQRPALDRRRCNLLVQRQMFGHIRWSFRQCLASGSGLAPPPTDAQVIAGTILGIAGMAIDASIHRRHW
jgi:hypothetical protein